MVGTPPHLVGDVERSTSWGAGIEEQVLGWVKFTLNTWIVGTEQRATRELLPGGWSAGAWYMKFSLQALLRGDSKARAAFYHSMIVDGWGNRNEVRDLEDWEAVDGLDEFIVPSNMTLVNIDGNYVPLAAQNQALDTTPEGG
jgi:HK97 family phage portal protein